MANKTTKKTAKKSAPTTKKSVKTTKKAPVKAAVIKPIKSEKSAPVSAAPVTSTRRTSEPVRFKKTYLIGGLVLLLLIALLYAGRSFFIAATVNGQPISRIELISELERQAGQTTLDSMVTKTLIMQEAKAKNVQVSDQQIDDEIKKIEDNLKQQGQQLDQVLSMQGMSRDSLRDQVRVQKTVEVLLGREIVVTDKEVTDYIASNSAALPQGMPEDQIKTTVQQQLRQQKLSEKFQTWLQELKQKASIDYLVNY